MMTVCSEGHEEIVHEGECPACNFSRQLSHMTDERDDALSKLEKAEAQVETLTQKIVSLDDKISELDSALAKSEEALRKLKHETSNLS
jgi:peptidoglycan hydrolase CwlO-like protein